MGGKHWLQPPKTATSNRYIALSDILADIFREQKKYNDEKSKPVIADADTYLNTNDEESLKTLYKKYKNIVDMVLNFLKKYMHGTTTVYRGFNISEEDYIDLICQGISMIPEEMVVHRLTGDAPRATLIGPMWSLKKWEVLNAIDKALVDRDIWQGKNFK